MQKTLRVLVVGLLVVSLSSTPAMAWWSCGGCYGGYDAGPVFYPGPVVYGGYCYETVVCGDCCAPCVDVCGCDCDSTMPGEIIVDSVTPEMTAPPAPEEAPGEMPPPRMPPRQPSSADRPVQVPPARQLPPEPAPMLTPAPTQPVTPEPVRPVPPAPPQPTEEADDDLFGGPSPPAESPATTPAEQPAEDDLFAPPPVQAPAPADTTPPPEPTPPAEDDDLFGAPLSAPADTGTPPAEEPPAEEQPAEDDDIFGAVRGVLQEPGGLASHELRTWVDNTGSYSCEGRLVRFLDGQIRILKANGRTTTVPLFRLSASDLEFVNRQAAAQQAQGIQTAQSPPTLPLMAN